MQEVILPRWAEDAWGGFDIRLKDYIGGLDYI
jgi:hypothetical protein